MPLPQHQPPRASTGAVKPHFFVPSQAASANVRAMPGKKWRSEAQRAALDKCNAARLDWACAGVCSSVQVDPAQVCCSHATPTSWTSTATPLLHMPQGQGQLGTGMFGGQSAPAERGVLTRRWPLVGRIKPYLLNQRLSMTAQTTATSISAKVSSRSAVLSIHCTCRAC